MPSKTVYLNANGRNTYVNGYKLKFAYGYPDVISFNESVSLNYDETSYEITFSLGSSIYEHLPENTRLTSLTLNYYYRMSLGTFNPSYEFGDRNDNYSDKIIRTLSSSSGFSRNSLTFNVNEVDNISNVSKIKVTADTRELIRPLLKKDSNYYRYTDYVIDFLWYEVYSGLPANSFFTIKNQNASSSYRPYLTLNYEHNSPVAPTSLTPDNSTENPRTSIRFTWNSRINQIAFQLQYQVDGGSWATVSQTTDNRYYELPAGTITATKGVVNWRVRVAEIAGVYSDYVSASFNLGASVNKPPHLSYPVGDFIKNAKTVNFSWVFVPNTIEEQIGYELQYRIGNGIWNTKSETTDRDNVDISLNITDSTSVEWRLRVKNQFNEWTSWTDTAKFQIIGSPPAPQIIEVSNTNNPIINWRSRDQEMFEITILDESDKAVYESGKVVGTSIRTHKVPIDLENGKYLIKLMTYNIYSVESPVTEYTHITNPEPITAPNVSLFESRFSVLIRSNVTDGTVIRDGKVLGQLKDGEFEDFSGVNKKDYDYSIRTKENDIFADSEIKSARVDFAHHNTLALVDELQDFVLLSYDLEGDPKKSVSLKVESEFIKLDGKKYSVVEVGEHEEETKSFSCFIEKKSELNKLIEFVKNKDIVLFRDSKGNNFEGFIQNLNYNYHSFGYEISFTLYKTGDFYD